MQHLPAAPPAPPGPARNVIQVAGIKHMIAVASGKGGVGKSTTAVNLALGLQAMGLATGILDADIYGPSQPRLLGLSGRPQVAQGNKLRPMQGHGLKAMSMGFMVEEGTPIIWRGPMVVSALTQMLRDVEWGDLDVLVIDMPPGTGDVQLTMAQQVPLAGAIIVSTPQDLALIDARKGLNMFRKVDVPVLGIIENMSYFRVPQVRGAFRHLRPRRRQERGRQARHPLPRRRAAAHGHPRHLRRGPADRGVEPGQRARADLPRHRCQGLGTAAGRVRRAPGAAQARHRPRSGRAASSAFAGAEPFTLSAEMLRVMSPSAEVQGHSPEQRVTVARKRTVKIKDLKPVGNYAVRIAFDDGHDTGLFTWPYLQTLHTERDKRWAEYLSSLAQKGLSRG